MSETVRTETIAKLPQLSIEQKLALTQLSWTMFFELFDAEVHAAFEQAIVDAKNGKRKLHNRLYQEIEEKVLDDFVGKLAKLEDEANIQTIRTELRNIVQQQKKAPELKPNQMYTASAHA